MLCAITFFAQVALSTFIDNVTIQVVERHIVHDLEEIFSPMAVAKMDKEEIRSIMSEPLNISRQRQHLEGRKRLLESGRGVFKALIRQSGLE